MRFESWVQVMLMLGKTGDEFIRSYRAFEGDMRVITKTKDGTLCRYSIENEETDPTLRIMF